MKKIKLNLVLSLFGILLALTSCKKEPIDLTIIDVVETVPDTLICDMTLAITGLIDTDSTFLISEVQGINAPFTYLWSDSSTTPQIYVEESGIYGLTVTDDLGCIVEDEYNYLDPCDLLEVNIELIDSTGFTMLNAVTTGGTEPYTFIWSENSITASITPDTIGVFSVTVTDATGCIEMDEITL